MVLTDVTELLRANLLEGVHVMLAAEPVESPSGALGGSLADACTMLGASVKRCRAEELEQDSLDAEVAAAGRIDLLVVDGAGLFGGGLSDGGDGHSSLRRCMDCAWNVTRAVVNLAFLPGDGGRIVYLAPAPDAGPRAEAARAGLENLARTLSVEWARHRITVVSIAPGHETSGRELAALVGYLASSAGAYFSGTQLDLRGVARLTD